MIQYNKNDKVRIEWSDGVRCINPFNFNLISTQATRCCHVHHPRRVFTNLEVRLGNARLTCFYAKQVARSRAPHRLYSPISFVAQSTL
jgi:hypothetical protein